jgi:hypothetical protein
MSALLWQLNRKKRRIRLLKSLLAVSVRCCTLILTFRIPCLLNLETFAEFWGLGENHKHVRRKSAKFASSCRINITHRRRAVFARLLSRRDRYNRGNLPLRARRTCSAKTASQVLQQTADAERPPLEIPPPKIYYGGGIVWQMTLFASFFIVART